MISHTNNMFLVSKTWFLRNTPRFRQLLILEFWYNVGAISLHSSKAQHFDKQKLVIGFWRQKNMVLMKYPKILTGVLLDILIQCRPKISVLFRNPKILTSKIGHGFLTSRNMVPIKQPRFWRVFYLKFWYNVGPISLFSLKKKKKKKKDFDKPYKQYVFGVKNLVLKKYPKISTVVDPGILIQCRRNIFALFKKPKILTSKSWSWVFWRQKNMVLMKYPNILTGVLLDILIQCRPKTCNLDTM